LKLARRLLRQSILDIELGTSNISCPAMFDILVYLFDNYFHTNACPEAGLLARKLSAAGFDDEEITEALEWLDGLQQASDDSAPGIGGGNRSMRIYNEEEVARLNVECRGFITFLEDAGALSPAMRELIIERALALSGAHVSLSRLKIIVLMVLWNQHQALDMLILEELISESDARFVH
jgi:Smg protein